MGTSEYTIPTTERYAAQIASCLENLIDLDQVVDELRHQLERASEMLRAAELERDCTVRRLRRLLAHYERSCAISRVVVADFERQRRLLQPDAPIKESA